MRGLVSHEMVVDGVRVVLTFKKVKNINLRVKGPDGHVEASAPPWVGADAVVSFMRAKMPWIRRRQQEVSAAPHGLDRDPSPADLKAWRVQVEPAARALVAQWEPRMGVSVAALAFRSMTSRWGSCNPKTGRVCINVQLAKYPAECLEYVVVHELCHFHERGHNARFKALLGSYLPDWKQRRALLR
ncbi:MAG: M48 family metallopeptidase [Eggerthellaceae bacterium]|nr:M48 family metallopeptidase [Eggerthellaceae bacterium]